MFKNRFPDLAKILEPYVPQKTDGQNLLDFLNKTFPFYNFHLAKNGSLTASENSLALHSAYNPNAEAERSAAVAKDCGKDILIFAGIGLGYLPIAAAKIPGAEEKTFVVLEPDPPHFFAALASLDFSPLLKMPKVFFVIGSSPEEAASLIHFAGGFDKAKIFSQKSQTARAQEWFDAFFKRAQEDKDKAQANLNTLERFGRLWLKNGARNLPQMKKLCGAKSFFGAADFSDKGGGVLPSVLLAAGPSLQVALPHLRQIKERAVTIAVDTALRACINAGVQPDFVFLTDPQYWASRHIAGLKAKESILIAESAAYPSVFRFDCKEIYLMSSLFPLGRIIEENLEKKGELASGGSVATSAWDFARAIGSKEIYAAGLDLGYPKKQTHIKGSAFEEAAHNFSCRLNPAELQSAGILFSAKNIKALDFEKKPIITDERMKLFASWFERQIANDSRTKTFSFSKDGLEIKGVEYFSLDDFLKKPSIVEEKKEFFLKAKNASRFEDEQKFDALIFRIKESLKKINAAAKKGEALCNDILCGDTRAQRRISELDEIDKAILGSQEKNIAALVFPTERQLEKIFLAAKFPQEPLLANAARSKIIYSELSKSIEEFLKIC